MAQSGRSIALFMHDLSGGGVERMRLRLAAGLADRGHSVQIIVQCARGPLVDQVPSGIKLIELGAPHSLAAMWALARTLRACPPDLLVSSLDHNNIVALCASILMGCRPKTIICQHNALRAESEVGWRYRLVPLLYWLLSWRADAIIAVSQGVAADLVTTAHLRPRHIRVIHNPVVPETHRTIATAPHPWLEPGCAPTFVFVGRLVAQKDPMLLLNALALRLRDGPVRLIICGDGPMLQQLKEKALALAIDDAVCFAGFIADPLPWMAAAAALLVTSRYEGFANVIVEAMWCGTPVIATDCAFGPSEILAGGRFGRLVRVGDAAALARCMKEKLREIFPRETLILRAQAFSTAACVTRHEQLFDQLFTPPRTKAFGLTLADIDAAAIAKRVLEQQPHRVQLVVTPNIDHLRLLREPLFNAAYQFATLVCPDGFPIAFYAWLRGVGTGRRVTGCDIFREVARQAGATSKRVLVVVEASETALALDRWAVNNGLQGLWRAVTAPQHLGSDKIAQQDMVTMINAHSPSILVLTLGAPTSEVFAYLNHEALGSCWILCVGQAVRVELGLARRAPIILRWCNLEWAWRLACEPRRLATRYILSALIFPALVMADLRRPRQRDGVTVN